METLMMRFQAQHRAARDLIAAGRIGKPVYARAQLSCWYPPLESACGARSRALVEADR